MSAKKPPALSSALAPAAAPLSVPLGAANASSNEMPRNTAPETALPTLITNQAAMAPPGTVAIDLVPENELTQHQKQQQRSQQDSADLTHLLLNPICDADHIVPDAEIFDVATYINERFTSESALDSELEDVMFSLRQAIASMDSELSSLIRAERHGGAKSARDVASAAVQLERLKSSIKEVQNSAKLSEQALSKATNRIQPLETARVNIKKTIDALRDMKELSTSLDVCEQAAKTKALRSLTESGVVLSRVSDIILKFKDVPAQGALVRLDEMRQRNNAVREELRKIVLSEFQAQCDAIGNDAPGEVHRIMLRSACTVADELGVSVQAEVIGLFIGRRMAAYEKFFASDQGGITTVDKRFAWLRNDIRNFESRGWSFVFPSIWNVSIRLAERVCKTIRIVVENDLAHKSRAGPLDVDLMLIALQKTVEFENHLDSSLEVVYVDADTRAAASQALSSATVEPKSLKRASIHDLRNQQEQSKDKTKASNNQQPIAGLPVESSKFRGIMSTVFEQYMDSYVAMEDKALAEIYEKLIQDETWVCQDKVAVFQSSVELFLQIKKSFRRCSKLTTHNTLYKMYRVYKALLKRYALLLFDTVKKRPVNDAVKQKALENVNAERARASNEVARNAGAAGSAATPTKPLTTADLDKPDAVSPVELKWVTESIILTGLITTAEYCSTTVNQLCESIQKQIDPSFVPEISLAEEAEQFLSVASRGVRYLVRLLMDVRLSNYFSSISSTDWISISQLDEVRPGIKQLCNDLEECVRTKAFELSKSYFRFFVERLCVSCAARVVTSIFRCKGISETGTQQLLLDLSLIKKSLLSLPQKAIPASASLSTSAESRMSASSDPVMLSMIATYTRLVNKEIGRVELLLKVLLVPKGAILEAYTEMVPDGNPTELQKLLELKQVSHTESESIVSVYVRRMGDSKNRVREVGEHGAGDSPRGMAQHGTSGSAMDAYSPNSRSMLPSHPPMVISSSSKAKYYNTPLNSSDEAMNRASSAPSIPSYLPSGGTDSSLSTSTTSMDQTMRSFLDKISGSISSTSSFMEQAASRTLEQYDRVKESGIIDQATETLRSKFSMPTGQ